MKPADHLVEFLKKANPPCSSSLILLDLNFILMRYQTIRTNGIYKEDNPYRSMIPQRIVDKYGHIKF